MATIQSGDSPGSRIEAGDGVLVAAKHVGTKPIAKRLAAFKKVHLAYRAADGKVQKSAVSLRKQQTKVAERDVDQDGAVLGLAAALPADGFPRVNPFKPFGAPSPAILCGLGHGVEAKQVIALATAVQKDKKTSAPSRAAAKKAALAAKHVTSAIAAIPKLEKARTDAISGRDALEQAWETAFAGLKRAARAAEDDGVKDLYAALFDRAPKPRAKKKADKPAPAKAAPPPAQDGASPA